MKDYKVIEGSCPISTMEYIPPRYLKVIQVTDNFIFEDYVDTGAIWDRAHNKPNSGQKFGFMGVILAPINKKVDTLSKMFEKDDN